MKISAIKTHLIEVGESLFSLLDIYLPRLEEKSILAITSKIISLSEGQIVPETVEKEELIKQESDFYLNTVNPYNVLLTIKNGILIPSAGIDASNGKGVYILYPQDIFASARKIWEYLRSKHQVDELGVIITDSHTTPMRWGVTGIGIGWCGIEPLNNYIGEPDCHGRPLHFTKVNVIDALAVSAVFAMGEGSEQTPLALLTDVHKVTFLNHPPAQDEIESFKIPMDKDLYGPLLREGDWIEGPRRG